MKPATAARIQRRGAALSWAISHADSALLHSKAIGPYLDAIDKALSPLTFSWLVSSRRDDLAMTLAGCRSRLQTQIQCEQLLALLHRIPDWHDVGTFSPGPSARLYQMEQDLLYKIAQFKRPREGGSFDFPEE